MSPTAGNQMYISISSNTNSLSQVLFVGKLLQLQMQTAKALISSLIMGRFEQCSEFYLLASTASRSLCTLGYACPTSERSKG